MTLRVFLFCCVFSSSAFAQTYTLQGKVSDPAGHVVPSATVTAKSVVTGKSFTSETGSDGTYSIRDLAGGDYMVSAVAGDLQAPPVKVTLAAAQTTDLIVSPVPKGAKAGVEGPLERITLAIAKCAAAVRFGLGSALDCAEMARLNSSWGMLLAY